MGNIVPSHLMDRNLYPFTTLQKTGEVNPGGDRAFDEEEDCGTPPSSAVQVAVRVHRNM
jgi:tRNA 2-thiocytidine biosynthesis protein TtcA